MRNSKIIERSDSKQRNIVLRGLPYKQSIVWWHGGITKSDKEGNQPNVTVIFRELHDNGSVSGFRMKTMPVTNLSHFRIGTIWKDGISHSEAELIRKDFYLNYEPGSWDITSINKALSQNEPLPINFNEYPFCHSNDRNNLLNFPFRDGSNLLIPCIEYFYSCYGYSTEVKRVLLTHRWDEVVARCFPSSGDQSTSREWHVTLGKGMVNDDAPFLAHIQHDAYTLRAAKRVHTGAEASRSSGNNMYFMSAAPWHKGKARLLVEGIAINNGKTFLGLRIVGSTEPKGPKISRDRENTNKVDEHADDDAPASAFAGTYNRELKIDDVNIELSSSDDPGRNTPEVTLSNPDFVILGERRDVEDIRRDKASTSSGPKLPSEAAGAYSAGERCGIENGIGRVSIVADLHLESRGVLSDVWNALRYFAEKRPDIIESVEWFSKEHGYLSEEDYSLISLPHFTQKEIGRMKGRAKSWFYLNKDARTVRGVLIIRVRAAGRTLHIIEIQRRPKVNENPNGELTPAEESLTGFIFEWRQHREVTSWIRNHYLRRICEEYGRNSFLEDECPGPAAAFKHCPAEDEKVRCESAVRSALKKMGIFV